MHPDRAGEAHRLRDRREPARRKRGPHPDRLGDGHGHLLLARAGPGAPGRRALRRVLARGGALRDVHRCPPVHGRQPGGGGHEARPRGPAADDRAGPRPAHAPAGDRRGRADQGRRGAVPVGRGDADRPHRLRAGPTAHLRVRAPRRSRPARPGSHDGGGGPGPAGAPRGRADPPAELVGHRGRRPRPRTPRGRDRVSPRRHRRRRGWRRRGHGRGPGGHRTALRPGVGHPHRGGLHRVAPRRRAERPGGRHRHRPGSRRRSPRREGLGDHGHRRQQRGDVAADGRPGLRRGLDQPPAAVGGGAAAQRGLRQAPGHGPRHHPGGGH